MNLNGKKILVVDDEEELRELLIAVISSDGAEVIAAENGVMALQLLNEHRFDAVVTDIRMPKGGGVELIKKIGTLSHRPKVFICSAFEDVQPEEYAHLGVTGSIAKPFKRKAMLETLHQALLG